MFYRREIGHIIFIIMNKRILKNVIFSLSYTYLRSFYYFYSLVCSRSSKNSKAISRKSTQKVKQQELIFKKFDMREVSFRLFFFLDPPSI